MQRFIWLPLEHGIRLLPAMCDPNVCMHGTAIQQLIVKCLEKLVCILPVICLVEFCNVIDYIMNACTVRTCSRTYVYISFYVINIRKYLSVPKIIIIIIKTNAICQLPSFTQLTAQIKKETLKENTWMK